MGLFPKNNEQLVKDTIVKLRAKRSDLVSTGDVDETTLENALMPRVGIPRAGQKYEGRVQTT